ncbi:peptidoglycan editing factor PgeF [Hydrogenophaga sp. OTU3427]|uniref:peptidoglycan editing factor PgeF n=1 Tax=Hydrogenophaga sp. OTU3427 TaxID=3043856 RepID=UPI00313D1221
MGGPLAGWLVPDWPAPDAVRAVFTTRGGGVSAAPFDSLNLGDHVGDAPAAVAANRGRLQETLGVQAVFMQQVHGTRTADLDHERSHAATLVADACTTAREGLACTVMVADCLPVLLTDTEGRWVGAAHAGWRGLAGVGDGPGGRGVIESVMADLCRRASEAGAAHTVQWLAWLGPCIGPQAFEVGAEVREAFVAHDRAADGCFRPRGPDKCLADLPALARQRLQRLGLNAVWGNDGSPPWCTVTQASAFFSHRRDAGRLGSTGRMAACIWRV